MWGDRCGAVAYDGDSVGQEGFAELGGEFWFGVRGEPADDGDLDPEPGEQLGLFEADESAADHHERSGQLGEFHRRGRREVIDLLEAGDRWDGRFGAGGDEIRLGANRSSIDEQC